MATQNEEALRELRADMETRRSNADKERQKVLPKPETESMNPELNLGNCKRNELIPARCPC